MGVAEDALQPGQDSCRGHRLVGEMTCRKPVAVFLTWKNERKEENTTEIVSFLTLMLLVQWVGLPKPHQTAEEQQRPEDLHKETHLDVEEFSRRQTTLPQHEASGGLLTSLC